jgi:hypothetical protein
MAILDGERVHFVGGEAYPLRHRTVCNYSWGHFCEVHDHPTHVVVPIEDYRRMASEVADPEEGT